MRPIPADFDYLMDRGLPVLTPIPAAAAVVVETVQRAGWLVGASMALMIAGLLTYAGLYSRTSAQLREARARLARLEEKLAREDDGSQD
ncbi:hypothetical protein [Rhodococcus sp. NPDC049939]|uniref:hypothetical protein n=1 Tax=Rhodococcus sp. NPDC049939 TaxID=3155511 RepID=UPI0033D3B27F